MPDERPRKPHTLDDHLFGVDPMHTHEEGDADHDHDHDDPGDEEPSTSSLWLQDHLTLLSVGIDVGSAGTQVIFSRVHLRRLSEQLTSRYFVVGRETVHQSPVALTPYADGNRIDERAIGTIIDEAYAAAGVHPDDVDAGAVILTGEALRRENAKAIADVLAEVGGEFVCATAGHHMEAMLAAYGSGAASVAHDRGEVVLNIDIGGGTTKLAVIEKGAVVRTAALHLGGRLAVVDEARRLVRLDPAGAQAAALAGCVWHLGDIVSPAEFDRVADWMGDTLVAALTGAPDRSAAAGLWLTDPIGDLSGVGGAMFSGGVAEYVYGREDREFGDLGLGFGRAVRQRLDGGSLPFRLLPPGECIRATAFGASEYTVQLSGNTIYLSSPGSLLPRRNLQVVKPRLAFGDDVSAGAVAEAIRDRLRSFDLDEGASEVALAFRWRGAPAYARLSALARGIVEAVPRTLAAGHPLFVVVDADVAQTLGTILRDELGVQSDVLVLDGVSLLDFDYIDLGRLRMPSFTVPVTIKSLVFSTDPRMPHHHHGHHHHHHHHHPDGSHGGHGHQR